MDQRGIVIITSNYNINIHRNTPTMSNFEDGSTIAKVGGVEMEQCLFIKVARLLLIF